MKKNENNFPMSIESQELALQNSTMRETEDIDKQATRIEKLINIQRKIAEQQSQSTEGSLKSAEQVRFGDQITSERFAVYVNPVDIRNNFERLREAIDSVNTSVLTQAANVKSVNKPNSDAPD